MSENPFHCLYSVSFRFIRNKFSALEKVRFELIWYLKFTFWKEVPESGLSKFFPILVFLPPIFKLVPREKIEYVRYLWNYITYSDTHFPQRPFYADSYDIKTLQIFNFRKNYFPHFSTIFANISVHKIRGKLKFWTGIYHSELKSQNLG